MARYADRLLSDGERVALRDAPALVRDDRRRAGSPWAILIAALVLVFLTRASGRTDAGRLVADVLGWLGLALLVVVARLAACRLYSSWYAQDYIVTNRRVIKVEGILNKHSADSSLEKINDAVLDQNLLGRMLRLRRPRHPDRGRGVGRSLPHALAGPSVQEDDARPEAPLERRTDGCAPVPMRAACPGAPTPVAARPTRRPAPTRLGRAGPPSRRSRR